MDQQLKVIHVIGGGEFGGAEQHIIQLLSLMPQHQVKGKVVCFYEAGLSKALRERNIEVEVLHFGRFDFRLISGLRKVFAQEQPDIIHTHGVKANFFARIAARSLRSTPLVTTVHSMLRFDYMNRGAYAVASAMERYTRSMNDHFIAVSHAIQSSLLEEGIQEQDITVVHHGIDFEAYSHRERSNVLDSAHPLLQQETADASTHPSLQQETADASTQSSLRHELGLSDDAYVIGVVTRLVKIKGIEYIIGAMPRIIQSEPHAHLVIVGEGPEEAAMKELVNKLNLHQYVSFTGFRNDVAHCLNSFDCFVSASLSEGLGLNVLEAMAASVPVVATGVGGILDFMKDRENGLLVEHSSSESLAIAVLEMIQHAELAEQLAQSAQALVAQQYAPSAMSGNTVQVYKKLLGERDV